MTALEMIEKALEPRDTAQRAALLAAGLGTHFLPSALTACWLDEAGEVMAAAFDADRRPAVDCAERLKQEVKRARAEARTHEWTSLSKDGVRFLAADISADRKCHGTLILGIAEEALDTGRLEAELCLLSSVLGARLALESTRVEVDKMQKKLQQERFLGDVGQIARPVVHELYNLLNTLSLQVEVLKLKFPSEAGHVDFGVLKKQVVGMVDVLKWFRNYRNNIAPTNVPFDMNRVMRDTVATLEREKALPGSLRLEVPSEPSMLVGSENDAERLLRFLLANADRSRDITVAARRDNGKLVMTVGPLRDNPGWELHQFLEAHKDAKEMCGPLELTAAKMLLERFRARVSAEQLPDKEVRAVIEIPLPKAT